MGKIGGGGRGGGEDITSEAVIVRLLKPCVAVVRGI